VLRRVSAVTTFGARIQGECPDPGSRFLPRIKNSLRARLR